MHFKHCPFWFDLLTFAFLSREKLLSSVTVGFIKNEFLWSSSFRCSSKVSLCKKSCLHTWQWCFGMRNLLFWLFFLMCSLLWRFRASKELNSKRQTTQIILSLGSMESSLLINTFWSFICLSSSLLITEWRLVFGGGMFSDSILLTILTFGSMYP